MELYLLLTRILSVNTFVLKGKSILNEHYQIEQNLKRVQCFTNTEKK